MFNPIRGASRFDRACRARVARDFELAKRLFRECIEENENVESSIRELAWTLHTNKESYDAIKLLERNLDRMSNKYKVLQVLSTIYEQTFQFENALPVLERVRTLAIREDRPRVDKRIAYSLFKLQRYEEAYSKLVQVSRAIPHDGTISELLEAMKKARESKRSMP